MSKTMYIKAHCATIDMHFLQYLHEQNGSVVTVSTPTILCVGCETDVVLYLQEQVGAGAVYTVPRTEAQHDAYAALEIEESLHVLQPTPLTPATYRSVPLSLNAAIIAVPWRLRHIFLLTDMLTSLLASQARVIHYYHAPCTASIQSLIDQYLAYRSFTEREYVCYQNTLLSYAQAPA